MKPTLLLLPTVALAGPLVLDQRQESAHIVSITPRGDGCPADSFSAVINQADNSAKVSFNNFAIRGGQGVPLDNKSASCDVGISMSFPGACKQALLKTKTDGYVLVAQDAGATAAIATRFRVSSGGTGDGAPPALIYHSAADKDTEVVVSRDYDVDIGAARETVNFTAHLQVLLNSPNATLASEALLEGIELILSQDGLC
ncbi:hypothetical protein MFIFM68171_07964 [Madurella fahalii]|uniref:Uncharacterized protein n=1 Tax=Madurella fahalii TaxID=1157608 RepID=A0ABQ0GJ19_9PEZI